MEYTKFEVILMHPVNLYDMETLAKRTMPHNMWTFVDAGSNDEITKRRNREALDRITVNSDFLVDINGRDLSTTVLGEKISFPVMIAPAGGQRQAHPEGELATAMGAGMSKTLMALATSSGYSIEEVSEVASSPLWWQLYHYNDEITEHLVKRAKTSGYKAICLTIDQPSPSHKERDLRNNYKSIPELHWGSLRNRPDLLQLREVGIPDQIDWDPPKFTGLTWDRLDWLRNLTGLPLVLKGISTVKEAVQCAEHNVDGIVVSNHGGRQMDSRKSSIETLVPIAEALSGSMTEIYLDSGIRRGQDVLKALALGARAVMVGRPLFWGLAYDGASGVHKMLEILREEFDRAMAYTGCIKVSDIKSSLVGLPCSCWTGSPIFHNH